MPLRSTTPEEQLRFMNEANKALTPLMTQHAIFCMNEQGYCGGTAAYTAGGAQGDATP